MTEQKQISEIKNDIMKIMKLAFMPLSTREIAYMIELPRPQTSTILKELEKDGLIQALPAYETPSKRDKYFIMNDESKEVEINFNCLEVSKLENKGNSINQFVTFLSPVDASLIAGVKVLKSGGIQRFKESAWVREIKEGIKKSPYPFMVNSVLIYIPEDAISIKKVNENTNTFMINIKIKRYQSEFKKPGWIVDGQQRLWALQMLLLENELYNSNNQDRNVSFEDLKMPIILLVGNFHDKDDSQKERDFLRFAFKIANTSKNLPKPFIGEILAGLGTEFILSKKEKENQIISKIREKLHIKSDSPFYGLIELQVHPTNDAYIKGSVMYNVIKVFYDYCKMYKLTEDEIYNIIHTYYEAVKRTWPDQWERSVSTKGKENWLVSQVGLGVLALLAQHFLGIKVKTITTSFVEEKLERIKDVNWDAFALGEQDIRNSRTGIKSLYEILLPEIIE